MRGDEDEPQNYDEDDIQSETEKSVVNLDIFTHTHCSFKPAFEP